MLRLLRVRIRVSISWPLSEQDWPVQYNYGIPVKASFNGLLLHRRQRLLRSYVLLDWYLNKRHPKVIGGTGIFRKGRDKVYPSPIAGQ